MKRGFLNKAFDKEKNLIAARNDQAQLHPSTRMDGRPILQDILTKQLPASREDLPPENRLPYGNLTQQEKALPEDYDKNLGSRSNWAIPTEFKTIPQPRDGDGSTEWVIRDDKTEGRVANTPGYPARTPKPRRPDLCEVRSTPDMGLGAFAKHNIKRGEIIISERPLLVAPSWLATVDNNGYSPSQTRQIMMFEFEKVLEVAVQRMNETDKALYLALQNCHTNDGTGPLLGIMRTNSFSADELSDNHLLHYSAVCNIGSRLNHSCQPNVIPSLKVSSLSFQFIAARDIKAGEELYCAYCDLSRTKAERQTDLAPYGFCCTCPACINATPATDKLRQTIGDQLSRLKARIKQPELMADAVASAKLLELEMIAEGLDVTFDFFSLLCVGLAACDRLGRKPETRNYEEKIRDYCKIHVHDWPSLQPFLQ